MKTLSFIFAFTFSFSGQNGKRSAAITFMIDLKCEKEKTRFELHVRRWGGAGGWRGKAIRYFCLSL